MANNDKNFKVKNGLDVKGSATVDNDLLVSGTLTAKTNTPTADSDVVNKAYVDAVDTHDSAAVQGQIDTALAGFTSYDSDAVDAQIDSAVTQSFVDALNVNADRLDGQHGAYYLDYNNFTNTPNILDSADVKIIADSAVDARTDQDLFTTSDVEFNKVTSNLVGSVHFTAQNDEGTALAKGDVVYIKGISGNTPTVAKADADDPTKMPAFGVVYAGANNGANVTITTLSVLEGIDTQTPGWSEGDTLYVATTAGELTNVKPTGESSLIQNIGQVTRVHTSTGSIKILGAGRTAATPNLDQNRIFIGNASNQAITMSLDSAVDSDHVQSKIKQSFIDTFDTHDSAAVAGQINSKFTNDATFSKDLTVDSDLTVNGVIKGPSTFIIDPALHGDSSGTLVILGNLQVDGVSTVIQSNTVSITDKNIVLADSATNATEANGAGITVNGANASITYVAVGDKWELNKAPYYLSNRLLTTADDTHDSAAVVGQINLEVDQAFVNALNVNADQLDGQHGAYYLDYNNFTNTPTIPALGTDYVDSAEVNTLIAAADTHDSAAVAGQIADTLNDTVTITKHSTTDPVLKLQSTVSTSDAAPIMEFVRNTNQANNGDYLGQIKFLGEDSSGTANGSGIVYAKMTGKIADPTDGTEDGLIEYMVKSNGSNLIMARMTGNSGGKLIMENGAGIEVASGNITIAGNTVLTTASDTHDSAAVVGQINAEVDKAFVDALAIDYSSLSNKPTIPVLGTDYVDSAEVNILIAAADTHDSAAVQGQIDANFATGFAVGGDITFSDSDDLILPDNSRIKLGDDADLQIYHDGNNSNIAEVGTGDLNINAQNLNLADGAPNFNYYFRGIAGGEVRLYHNGSQKLATKSTGVDVTGTITADGLTVDTNTLHVDATNDRVGINSTTPEQALHVEGQVVVDGGTGVSSTGVLHVRQNGDTSGNGITITSSNAISHRIWKSAGGALSFGPSTDPDAFTQDLSGNITVAGEVFVDTLTPSTDSALASKAYVDANTSSASHTVAIGLLGAGLDVGDPVFYDSDAVKWVGAVDSDDGVASHIIVEKNTGVDFKIAQTGVFILTPNQGLDINAYYFLGSTAGAATNTQPATGINQSLFYALDSSTIDINIAEATDLSAQSASSIITGNSAAGPAPNVEGDTDTGLFSSSADTLSVSAGGTEISSFSSTGLEVKSGVGIPNYVSLSQGAVGAGVTYNIDAGNTASLTTDSDKTITLTTTGGNFTGLGGTSATLLIKNNTSPDSDRTMTFVTSSGNTLHFNSANTLTVAGGKISIVSAMVFGNNDLVLSAVSLDSSVTY